MDIVAVLKEIVTTFDDSATPTGETIGEVLTELKTAISSYITAASGTSGSAQT